MTVEELETIFEDNHDQFLLFAYVVNPMHLRPDLCAFLMLDKLVPGCLDMVAGADHDEIYLEVSTEKLAAVASKDQLIDLIRCGVRLHEDGYLCMFV